MTQMTPRTGRGSEAIEVQRGSARFIDSVVDSMADSGVSEAQKRTPAGPTTPHTCGQTTQCPTWVLSPTQVLRLTQVVNIPVAVEEIKLPGSGAVITQPEILKIRVPKNITTQPCNSIIRLAEPSWGVNIMQDVR